MGDGGLNLIGMVFGGLRHAHSSQDHLIVKSKGRIDVRQGSVILPPREGRSRLVAQGASDLIKRKAARRRPARIA